MSFKHNNFSDSWKIKYNFNLNIVYKFLYYVYNYDINKFKN